VNDQLLRVRDLRVRFGGTTAVDGIGFDIGPGRCVALVGESGSGKSVTGRSLLGLAGRSARVDAAELSLDGRDLRELSERRWRDIRGAEIGLVLQDALVSLDPLVRVGAQVGDALRVHADVPRAERAQRATRLLRDVGVPEPDVRAAQYPHQLSGGLRQRALIASAIAASPRIIIADEPTTALDVTVQAQVLALLGRLREDGAGLLLISHDLAVVGALADEIIVLRDGEVVERGEAAQVLEQPTAEYTRELIAAVPSAAVRGARLSPQPVSVFERVDDQRDPRPLDLPALRVSGLSKSFRLPGGAEIRAVDDVSFTLDRGGALGVVGESGSGKSTTAAMVLGLVEPDAGSVELDGEPWAPLPERRRRSRRRRMQVISQDPLSSFDPRADVAGLIGEALGAVGVPRSAREARTVGLLEQVGLSASLLRRHPLQLSGGQRQRVAICRALAVDPEVLVCDEPVSALDVSVQAQVLDLLGDLRAQLGVSFLFISHDLGVIRHVTDDVAVMRGGRIVERGPTEEVFLDPRDTYTRELIQAIPVLR